ncbi:MAG: DUF3090 family protein [Actinomycetales bacterium]|nr:DUF3090 family protein [Actinomycetales bacterium]
MSMLLHEFSEPDRCVVGTVGGPGERAFYLQVRKGNAVISMLFEKEQARLLALRLGDLLEEETATGAPEPPATPDNGPLDMPLAEEFRVMRLSLMWDPQQRRAVIQAWSRGDDDDQDAETTDDASEDEPSVSVRIHLDVPHAQEFVRRTLAVVAAGRRTCPLCEQPVHPSGHICPRANGYHRLR